MQITPNILEAVPLLLAFGSAILSMFYELGKRWQTYVLSILFFLFLYFTALFFFPVASVSHIAHGFFDISFNKISLFVGMLFTGSLLIGLFPVRNEISLSSYFIFYIAGGIGIILSNNLPTFFMFWTFQRAIPCIGFIKDLRNGESNIGGTYIIQHFLTFFCFIALMIFAYNANVLYLPLTEIPANFFSWPVLILAFIIIYQSHGIFPFHSWVHDVVGKMPWYEISSLFLSRAGLLLFAQMLLPTFNYDPDIFKISLLVFSIISSIYWSFRGLFELNANRTVTYFYIAQASLLLTGLQADRTAAIGSYLHMMVISVCGTALWSLLSYVQHHFNLKRSYQFYGLAQNFPRVSTLFCLFGFCMIGVPFGASFVVEDLVINGLLDQQPYLGLGHILASCLNGILFFSVFTRFFLGHSPYKEKVVKLDMTLSQMSPYLLGLLLMILIGIIPSLFLEKIKW